MKKTASQKIARVFEIAGYLWLMPSLMILLYPFLILLDGLFRVNAMGIMYGAIPCLIFAAGFFLLVQYYRHSRGLLGEGKINALWIGTLVFNLLFLLPSVYGFYLLSRDGHYPRANEKVGVIIWGVMVLWWAMAVLMSVTALMSRFRRQKYL